MNLPIAKLFAPISVYHGVDRMAYPPYGKSRESNAAPGQWASSPAILHTAFTTPEE